MIPVVMVKGKRVPSATAEALLVKSGAAAFRGAIEQPSVQLTSSEPRQLRMFLVTKV